MLKKLLDKIKLIQSKILASIQAKFIIFIVSILLLLSVANISLYFQIRKVVFNTMDFYLVNVDLNEIQGLLGSIQTDIIHYKTRTTRNLKEKILESQTNLNEYQNKLNDQITDQPMLLAEKNINDLLNTYKKITHAILIDTDQLKMNPNYDDLDHIYGYLNTSISSLNNMKFKINTTNYQQALSVFKTAEIYYLPLLMILIFVCISLVFIFFRSMIIPLKELVHATKAISEEKLRPPILKTNRTDEIGTLTLAFNHMVNQMQMHIEYIKKGMKRESKMRAQELQMLADLQEARYKNLQAQINPHFLFNTLNAGAQLAMMSGDGSCYTYLQAVADFYRYNIHLVSKNMTLTDEIKLVENYIYIMNVRYGGEINYTQDINANTDTVKLPWMTLQPLIENSIKYCAELQEQKEEQNQAYKTKIALIIKKENNKTIITIKDNGLGMTQKTIDSILSSCEKTEPIIQIKSEPKEKQHQRIQTVIDKYIENQIGMQTRPQSYANSNGISIRNILKRLKLYYEDQSSFDIKSQGLGHGTEIIITIPIKGE